MGIFLLNLTYFILATANLAEAAPGKGECVKAGEIRYQDEKGKSETAAYCFNRAKLFLVSDCADPKNCEAAKTRILPVQAKGLAGTIGNPLHHQCRLAGGTPRVAEVKVEKDWWPTGLCKFADGSFAGIETWALHWVKFE